MRDILYWLRRSAGIALWMLLLGGVSPAATWGTAPTQLAAKIAELSGQAGVHLTAKNASSLAFVQVQEFTREVEAALRARGVRLVTSNAGLEVTVTAGENARAYVFVAQAQLGREVRTAMVTAPKETTSSAQGGAVVTLRKTLLVEQDEPVLDGLLMDGGSQLMILSPGRVRAFKRSGERWQEQSSFEMQHARPWPLDMRGRVVSTGERAFDVYLPGMVCNSQTLAPLVMSCKHADDPWPIGEGRSAFFNAGRNYFNGVISPGIGASAEPFYTAVALNRADGTAWMLTGVDGAVRWVDGKQTITLSSAAVREWGSDVAVLNGCGKGQLIVASGGNDGVVPDTLRAFDLSERTPVGVSALLNMPGPVTALWSQADRMSAVAVAHSLETGKYHAYAIAVSCTQ